MHSDYNRTTGYFMIFLLSYIVFPAFFSRSQLILLLFLVLCDRMSCCNCPSILRFCWIVFSWCWKCWVMCNSHWVIEAYWLLTWCHWLPANKWYYWSDLSCCPTGFWGIAVFIYLFHRTRNILGDCVILVVCRPSWFSWKIVKIPFKRSVMFISYFFIFSFMNLA